MRGFHQDGLGHYLDALKQSHHLALSELRRQSQQATTPEKLAGLVRQIAEQHKAYQAQVHAARQSLF